MKFTIEYRNNKLLLCADGVPLPGVSDVSINSHNEYPTVSVEIALHSGIPNRFTFVDKQ